MKHVVGVILFGLIVLAFFLRFYRLGEIPMGLYQDETAIGYNAYSILKTSKDEHGQSFPLYFQSFGDQKLPLYVYLTVPSVALFGLNEFAVRFPSALFGVLTVIVFYFFMKTVTKDVRLALVSTALLVINPWHLHYSRATFEVSISLFLLVSGALLLIKGLEGKRQALFILGTLLFLLNVYTYNLTRLLSPLLYFLILFVYRRRLSDVSKATYGLSIFFSFLLILPFAVTFFGDGGVLSASGTLIWSSAAVQAPLLELRSFFFHSPSLFTKTFFNTPLLTFWQFLTNIASYLSAPFFFLTGSQHGNHGIGNVGQFYLIELPFFLLGVFLSLKKKIDGSRLFFLLASGVIVIASLTREAPHATRSFFLIPSVFFFITVGALSFYDALTMKHGSIWKKGVFLGVCLIALYNIVYYFSSYYVRFPVYFAPKWRSADKDVISYLRENDRKYDRVVFDKKAGFIYSSLLFYLPMSPHFFQGNAAWYPSDSEGFRLLERTGKYTFKDIDWETDLATPKTVIVTTNASKPEAVAAQKVFYYPQRPVVVSLGQEIVQFPVEEQAYVLVETK